MDESIGKISLSFTVRFLIPPSVNRYKIAGKFTDRNTGAVRFGYKLSKATKAYYEAVAIFARGDSVTPLDDKDKPKARYEVWVDIYLGKGQRGDEDNFAKTAIDALVKARVIHSDAKCHSHITVHDDHRDSILSPRTEYRVIRRFEDAKEG